VAREWCENQRYSWTGHYHDHVVTRLEADALPEIGARPIAEVERPELLAVLRKVEKRGALEIAKRLRQTESSDTASSRAGRTGTPRLT
jgi:integrase